MSASKGNVRKIVSALAIVAISASLGVIVDWRAPGIARYTRDWLMRARGPLPLGTAYLYGSGLIFLMMLALSVEHIRWTVVSVVVAGLAAMVGSSLFVIRPDGRVAYVTKPFKVMVPSAYTELAAVVDNLALPPKADSAK